jgi:hypothetical protein
MNEFDERVALIAKPLVLVPSVSVDVVFVHAASLQAAAPARTGFAGRAWSGDSLL